MIIASSPRKLHSMGVLGINSRNINYVMRYNPRYLYPLVDDKLETKEAALKAGINVPKLYSVIKFNYQLKTLGDLLDTYQKVAIKPAHGSGGKGIMVLKGKVGKLYRKPNDELVDLNTIKHYISNILSGMYSISGLTDKAFLEYGIQFDPFFNNICFKGVPDIRIVVFRGVPITAMARLPTLKSNGKANLHQGAIGVGVNISTGLTTYGVFSNQVTKVHPDTHYSIHGLEIPNWQKIIEIAVKCADTVGLGYLGVDIVLDQTLGPLMLELNARPGLSVQIANQQGLQKSLEYIDRLEYLPKDPQARIELGRNLAKK